MKVRCLIVFICTFLHACSEDHVIPVVDCGTGEIDEKIILIFVDDMGIDDTQLFNEHGTEVTHLNNLKRDAVSFDQAYVASSICSPSRAALLTGRYPQKFGFENNAHSTDPEHGVPTSIPIISELLNSYDYNCALVGKWHLGEANIHNPINRGFNYFFGHLKGTLTYSTFTEELICSNLEISDQFELFDNNVKLNEYKYSTELFTDKSIQYIEENKSNNFFLYLSYNAPHTPLQTKESYLNAVNKSTNRDNRIYYSMIKAIDEGVGRLTDKLKELNIYEETTIIFLSDNGCNKRLGYCNEMNALRGGKATLYEGGIRTSLIYKTNKFVEKNTSYKYPVTSMDIVATLLDVSCPDANNLAFDGVNLKSYVNNGDNPNRPIFWRLNKQKAVLFEGFKWINNESGEQLYNLENDPYETVNIIDKNKSITDDLKVKYKQWDKYTIKARW